LDLNSLNLVHKYANYEKSVLILLIALWCLPIHAQTEGFWRRVNQDMSSSKIDKMGKEQAKAGITISIE
jgi:hypothetical protein